MMVAIFLVSTVLLALTLTAITPSHADTEDLIQYVPLDTNWTYALEFDKAESDILWVTAIVDPEGGQCDGLLKVNYTKILLGEPDYYTLYYRYLGFVVFWDIAIDNEGNLWMTRFGFGGLTKFNPTTEEWTDYTHSETGHIGQTNIIYKDGLLYSTGFWHLEIYDPVADTFEQIQLGYFELDAHWYAPFGMCEDGQYLWITMGDDMNCNPRGSLLKFDTVTKTVVENITIPYRGAGVCCDENNVYFGLRDPEWSGNLFIGNYSKIDGIVRWIYTDVPNLAWNVWYTNVDTYGNVWMCDMVGQCACAVNGLPDAIGIKVFGGSQNAIIQKGDKMIVAGNGISITKGFSAMEDIDDGGLALIQIPQTIEITGDINHDFSVNAKDAIVLGVAFSSKEGDPSWNPEADINNDTWVNAKDALLLGTNFGYSLF